MVGHLPRLTICGTAAFHEELARNIRRAMPVSEHQRLSIEADAVLAGMAGMGLNVRDGIIVAEIVRWRLISGLLET